MKVQMRDEDERRFDLEKGDFAITPHLQLRR